MAYLVRADSREEHELKAACSLPEGPRKRWFAGFFVSADGVVVAPHARTVGCTRYSTGVGAHRRALKLLAVEDGLTLLKLEGGAPHRVMPPYELSTSDLRYQVTVLGVDGVEPRVSAGITLPPGANQDDAGWPQVLTLTRFSLREGLVWNDGGAAIGLLVATTGNADTHAFGRLVPAKEVRRILAKQGLAWEPAALLPSEPADAMRLALAATLPLTCEQGP